MSHVPARDLSDNAVRGAVLTSLIEAASEGAPVKQPHWAHPRVSSTPPVSDTSLEYVHENFKTVVRYPDTKHVVMWRLDIPRQAIVYTGDGSDVQPNAPSQHHLPKIAFKYTQAGKSPVGGIVDTQAASPTPRSVKDCLKCFAAKELWTHPDNVVLIEREEDRRTVMPVTCTTLAESVACLALHDTEALVTANMGESPSWTDQARDPRYAEHQWGINGFRFREWVAVHQDENGIKQSRLAAHCIAFDCVYSQFIPWTIHEKKIVWVKVASTLPVDCKAMNGDTLEEAVRECFLRDAATIPITPGDIVNIKDCEVYTEASGAVGIGYSLRNSRMTHMIIVEPHDG